MPSLRVLSKPERAVIARRVHAALFADVAEEAIVVDLLVERPSLLEHLDSVDKCVPGFPAVAAPLREDLLKQLAVAGSKRLEAKSIVLVAALMTDGAGGYGEVLELVAVGRGNDAFVADALECTALPPGALTKICRLRPRKGQGSPGPDRLEALAQRRLALRLMDGAPAEAFAEMIDLVRDLGRQSSEAMLSEFAELRGPVLADAINDRRAQVVVVEKVVSPASISPAHGAFFRIATAIDPSEPRAEQHGPDFSDPFRQALAKIPVGRLTEAVVASPEIKRMNASERLVFLQLIADNPGLTDTQALHLVSQLGHAASDGFGRSVRSGEGLPLRDTVIAAVAEIGDRYPFEVHHVRAYQMLAATRADGDLRTLAERCAVVESRDLWQRLIVLMVEHPDTVHELADRLVDQPQSYRSLDEFRADARQRRVEQPERIDVLELAARVLSGK